jgi:hypothetical protein
MNELTEKVRAELARYEHPLFVFGARPAAEGVEVEICYSPCTNGIRASQESFSASIEPGSEIHAYVFLLRPREIENKQFPWMFQKQLYDCLHDFIIEMFTCNPQRQDV